MIGIVVGIICGVISACIASSKGRSAVGWFFGGFFLGIIGLIILACLSNLNDEKARRQSVDMEQRRLREQLRQEQLKVESLRRYSAARLDAHDQALGIDTRNQPQLLTADDPNQLMLPVEDPAAALERLANPDQPQPLAATAQPVPVRPIDQTQWFYERAGGPVGPVSSSEVQYLLSSRAIEPGTLVWCSNFSDWVPANQTVEFRQAAAV